MTQLKETEENKTENINLKQKLKETEVNIALKGDELVKLKKWNCLTLSHRKIPLLNKRP